ncbi:TetR/AcrR family transcriptional regulator [Nocardia sp. NPDC058705]|uniref:TetR/AcrR family transcriptional regulator n=1 Tax=Nocardia sp. NPDC058705 TaxID=3346609 RepID=UPI00368F57AC
MYSSRALSFLNRPILAGVSVRSVQYYFGTKREFILATHRAVVEDSGARMAQGFAALGPDAGPRDVVRAMLMSVLPLDEPSRRDAVILGIFHAATLTGPDVESADTVGAPNYIVDAVAGQLRALRGPDADEKTVVADAEVILLALGGLAQGMLTNDDYAARAPQLVDHLLDRVLDA